MKISDMIVLATSGVSFPAFVMEHGKFRIVQFIKVVKKRDVAFLPKSSEGRFEMDNIKVKTSFVLSCEYALNIPNSDEGEPEEQYIEAGMSSKTIAGPKMPLSSMAIKEVAHKRLKARLEQCAKMYDQITRSTTPLTAMSGSNNFEENYIDDDEIENFNDDFNINEDDDNNDTFESPSSPQTLSMEMISELDKNIEDMVDGIIRSLSYESSLTTDEDGFQSVSVANFWPMVGDAGDLPESSRSDIKSFLKEDFSETLSNIIGAM